MNAQDFNRKKFDEGNWLGIVLPQSSQERQMKGFGGFSIRRKVAIMGHTPSNRGEIDDKDVVFAIIAIPATSGTGAGNRKKTPRISQGDVVYGTFLDKDTKQSPIVLGLLGRTANITYEKGVYARYDITSGFVGQTKALKLLGREQTNEDDRDCSPLALPFADGLKEAAGGLLEESGLPTIPTVNSIPIPFKKVEESNLSDSDLDEEIGVTESKINRYEKIKENMDAQEAASSGSIDRRAYQQNEQNLDDAVNELHDLKEVEHVREQRDKRELERLDKILKQEDGLSTNK